MTPPVPPSSASVPPEDPAGPGLPGFHTWRGVYLFVLGCFILWVGLLALLTGLFS
jgi:hypothetical protein